MELTFFRRFVLDICSLAGMGTAREPKEYTDGPSDKSRRARRKFVDSAAESCESAFSEGAGVEGRAGEGQEGSTL